MKSIRLAVLMLAAFMLSGCYVNLTGPAPQLSVPLTAETPRVQGEATCTQLLWAFMFGDCSIAAAMNDADIQQVHHVDGSLKVIFYGAYSEATVKVYGE